MEPGYNQILENQTMLSQYNNKYGKIAGRIYDLNFHKRFIIIMGYLSEQYSGRKS